MACKNVWKLKIKFKIHWSICTCPFRLHRCQFACCRCVFFIINFDLVWPEIVFIYKHAFRQSKKSASTGKTNRREKSFNLNCLPNGFHPFLSFAFAFHMKCSFNNVGPLQTAYNKCKWFRAIDAHDLASAYRKIVELFDGICAVRFGFVSHQRAIISQYKIAWSPIFNMFAPFIQPSLFHNIGRCYCRSRRCHCTKRFIYWHGRRFVYCFCLIIIIIFGIFICLLDCFFSYSFCCCWKPVNLILNYSLCNYNLKKNEHQKICFTD